MKAFAILSFLGLLSSTIIAAPSHFGKRDFNVFLHTPASDHIQTNLSPSLRHGVYTITSPALDHDFAIGQDTADFPHFPKQIKTVATSDPAFQTNWYVEPLSNGHYILWSGQEHWPVINGRGRLFAAPFPGPPPTQWAIEYDDDRDGFTVVSADEGLGWVVNPDLNAQVEVRPLENRPTEVFTFTQVFDDVKASSKKAGLNIEITVEDL